MIFLVNVEEAFGSKGQARMQGKINGHTFRSSAWPHGNGKHYIVVNKSIREAIGVFKGDQVQVVLECDSAPRIVGVPADFEQTLSIHKKQQQVFDKHSDSHQKEYVDWIVSAKREETRVRRIDKALEILQAGTTPKIKK